VLGGILKRACSTAAERCDCDEYAGASGTPIDPPSPNLVPMALLEGPEELGACEGEAPLTRRRRVSCMPRRCLFTK
jgi:hypothetical protein